MGQIISIKNLKIIQKVKKSGKELVLFGCCFDVLHPCHVIFLEQAKAVGDILIVLLESDQKIKQLKGVNRPLHIQVERAKVLSALNSVDFIVTIPFMEEDKEYDEIIIKIKPDIIAVTQGYENIEHHKRSAKLVGAKLKFVTKIIGNYSTSRILGIDF